MTALSHLFARLSDMDEMILILAGAVFLTALASGTLLTALMHWVSWRIGALDKPDSELKCHRTPTATLGVVALFLAAIAGVAVLAGAGYGLNPDGLFKYMSLNISCGALLVAGLIMVILGVTDDLYHVMPRTKLLFQMLASTVMIGSGLVIHHCGFFGVFDFFL